MAARKKSTSDVVAEVQEAVDELAKVGIVADGGAEARAMQSAVGIVEFHGTPDREAMAAELHGLITDEPVERPRITRLQLHTRAHILGIQGTSDSLVVGDVIESIEPDMLGPIPGFVVRLKREAPVFMPQASVLAVTVVG